jgi:endogenous inhibitor of DNA gyrase (YacG/DUF329 family)
MFRDDLSGMFVWNVKGISLQKETSMLPEGKCPKCGSHFCGWALKLPPHQMCPKCGMSLEITEDGRHYSTGYSPFTADEYKFNDQTDWAQFEREFLRGKNRKEKNKDKDDK